MGWLIFAKGCAHQQSGQTKEETDHRPAAQGQKMGSMLYNQKAGGTRRQLVLCKGLDEGMKAGQRPPHQTCCAVQSSGALCTLQSQLGATEPPASALCCSHPQQPWSTQARTSTSPGFQIARAGHFGPRAFITNLFSFLQSPATKETRHTDSRRRCSISLIFYCIPE